MNSLDFRYELLKLVRKLASLADAPILGKEWDGVWKLADEARELLEKQG